MNKPVTIISAPSILGLTPGGVARLPQVLLNAGLAERTGADEIVEVPALNHLYKDKRDAATQCLNPKAVVEFSKSLSAEVVKAVKQGRFTLVLGGDCSILIGIMSGLKSIGNHGLAFIDAHADFYLPKQSPIGEVADMDLAIVTGRGPEELTNIDGLKPYVKDENVIHIGQRDEDEIVEYGGTDIVNTSISCFPLKQIREEGITSVAEFVIRQVKQLDVDGIWIHFDTDVLDDAINPAVDYRLPGGLSADEARHIIKALVNSGKIAGMSVTIFNPDLDNDGAIAKMITAILADVLM